MHGIIYVVTNVITGKRYVGQTTQPMMTRWKRHLSDALGAKRRPHPLHEAIRKYGRDVWTVETLATTTPFDDLNIREAAAIVALGTLHPAGYNLKPGGGNAGHHEETKRKLAEALRGRKLPADVVAKLKAAHRGRPQTAGQRAGLEKILAMNAERAGKPGRKMTPEERAKLSAARTGVPKSAEHRAKIGAAHIGMKRSEETRRRISEAGKRRQPVSAETRQKLSAALRGRAGRPVSEAARAKIGAANRGRKLPPWTEERRERAREAARAGWERRRASVS